MSQVPSTVPAPLADRSGATQSAASGFFVIEIRATSTSRYHAAVRAVEELEARHFDTPDELCRFLHAAALAASACCTDAIDTALSPTIACGSCR